MTRLSGSDRARTGPGRGPTRVVVRVEDDSLVVSVHDFIYYCSPPPTFAAHLEGDLLVVQSEAPTTSAARCVGPHSARLRLDGVPAGGRDISIREQGGREVATAHVPGAN